jgi:hypothetical protein
MAIVRAVGKCKRTVDRWQERYMTRKLAGLQRDAKNSFGRVEKNSE